ncbi:pre-rRNA-processing protein ESF2 [Aristolochia californica]|uniref:pre-rRNA-processing protein ESF2 n=1 Tax=Aristolochia californica TaxID=171875 RepID=UPI0035D8A875
MMSDVEEEQGHNIDETPNGEQASFAGVVDGEKSKKGKRKRKRHSDKEAGATDKRGVCYLSRVPPHMNPLKLRQILSQFGEIQRIYLTPEDPTARFQRKRAGGFRGQEFSEGWVEFAKKSMAKRVANMLNGEQIGGKKRSSFYYDLWNIKYLSKFKWDDLTEEIANKEAIRKQKLTLELSLAKKERDFYISREEKSRAQEAIQERLQKKQKTRESTELNANIAMVTEKPKIIRKFQQTLSVVDHMNENKPKLSKGLLVGVFGVSS